MENIKDFLEYAPLIIVILMYMHQNNIFVKPEQLEQKHREIVKEIEADIKDKYVELNAYKEFQGRVYAELTEVNNGINELKEYLMKGTNKI